MKKFGHYIRTYIFYGTSFKSLIGIVASHSCTFCKDLILGPAPEGEGGQTLE